MKIALVGNQNSGKTTLFNLLTGSNQKVGNWPGVTIEHKSGIIKGTDYELVDLPGIYSLSPYTLEEEVSRQFIFKEKLDYIINIIDATSLERSLYLTTQLMELDTKLIVVLNMADVLERKKVKIEVDKLSDSLGVKIFQISALKNIGIDSLIELIKNKNFLGKKKTNIFSNDMEKAISKVSNHLDILHKRFVSIKLLEKDPMFDSLQNEEIKAIVIELENKYQSDMEEIIAKGRYDWIDNIKSECLFVVEKIHTSLTTKLDRIFLNKFLAIPLFILIMFLVYFISVGLVGGKTTSLFANLISSFRDWLRISLFQIGASSWSVSLIVDGIIVGVGAVINFVPQLFMLFLCISILETTGYMARISFIFDKMFKKFGLSGKALVPFIVGSGCSVPGIMATRTIENKTERKMSIILTPFIPCSAKLPIIALFSGFFFEEYVGLVSASLYFLAIIIIIISAIILKKLIFKGNPSTYISELVEYKAPNFRYVMRDVLSRTWAFIKKAGTIIFGASIILWFLLSFSWEFQYGVDINKSILASIGKVLAWFFYPFLGEYSWAATISAIQGLIAKEQIVSSMAIINGLSTNVHDANLIFHVGGAFNFFTAPSAYAFMVFNLFSAPCLASIGAMRKEFGRTKDVLFAIFFQTFLALIVATLVFWIGNFIGVLW